MVVAASDENRSGATFYASSSSPRPDSRSSNSENSIFISSRIKPTKADEDKADEEYDYFDLSRISSSISEPVTPIETQYSKPQPDGQQVSVLFNDF